MDKGATGTPANSVSTTQFYELMKAIRLSQEAVDKKLASFQVELKANHEKVTESALRKVRQGTPYTWWKKGHKEQAKFNSRVDEALLETQVELESIPPDAPQAATVKKAQQAIKQGRELLAERLKFLKTADQSELRWAVVAEYTADELADDSEDEKRSERAEKVAERKAFKRHKTSDQRSSMMKRKPPTNTHLPTPVTTGQSTSLSLPPRHPQPPTLVPRQPGPCFACGQMGHLRAFCPRTPTSGQKS